jgi:hypothetical protein
MYLIVLMFAFQTIHNADYWYRVWVAFITDDGNPQQELIVIENVRTTRVLHATGMLEDILTTSRLAIADSIMVSSEPRVQ